MTDGQTTRDRAFQDVPAVGWRWIVPVSALMVIALALSGYLSYVSVSGGAAIGCGEGDLLGCGHVLRSRWSRWVGVPVSVAAAGLYAVMLVSVVFVRPSVGPRGRRVAWGVMLALAMTAAGSAVWFISLLGLAVGTVCVYCLAAHACGLSVAAAVLVVNLRRGSAGAITARKRRMRVAWCLLPAAAALAALIGGQLLVVPRRFELVESSGVAPPAAISTTLARLAEVPASMPASQDSYAATPPKPHRGVSVAEGRIRLNVYDHPFVGRPDAIHALVEFFDYTCLDCRKMHRQLDASRRRYPGKIVVVAMARPLCADCNPHIVRTAPQHRTACELARIAMAVWLADATAFESFHQWMMAVTHPPSPAEARAEAARRVGDAALQKALADPLVDQALRRYMDAFEAMPGAKNLPKLLLPEIIMVGVPATTGEFFKLLEQHLHLGPPSP